MRKLHAVWLMAVVTFSSIAVAQEEGGEEGSLQTVNEPVKEASAEVGQEAGVRKADSGYGSAGCGLGSLLFEPSNGFTQVFAATTNGSSGTQTFGITSGTSNCDSSGYSAASAASFIETNRAALAKDIARGKGATIAGLSDLAGCKSPKAVGAKLQKSFKRIFPNARATDQQVSQSVLGVLKQDKSLACANLG